MDTIGTIHTIRSTLPQKVQSLSSRLPTSTADLPRL